MSSEEEVKEVSAEKKEEKVDDEDLKNMLAAKEKVQQAVNVANRATNDARIADLEYKVMVQHIFIKNNLSFNDKIDDATGVITRGTSEEPQKEDGNNVSA